MGEEWRQWHFDIGKCDAYRIVAVDNSTENCGWMALKYINRQYKFISQIKWVLLVFSFYICILYLYDTEPGFGYNFFARRFMPTVDNEFPLAFVEKIISGEKDFSLLGWKTSDRPPLLAAMYSTLCCFMPHYYWEKLYMISALLIQLSIWFIIFDMFNFFNMDKFQRKYLKILIGFSSTVCMSTIFTWPQFMACTFYFTAIILLFDWFEGKKLGRVRQYLVGGCMALAMLSHGNIAFAILAVGLCCIFYKKVQWKETPRIVVAFFVIYAPWMFYQKVIAPPGTYC